MKNTLKEISLRYTAGMNLEEQETINQSSNLAALFYKHWNQNTIELRETAKVIFFNSKLKPKGILTISEGGTNSTIIDRKMIFSVALKSMSSAFAVCHNHPSGNLDPSRNDKNLTIDLYAGAKTLDITFIDHIILAPNGKYYSFADNDNLAY